MDVPSTVHALDVTTVPVAFPCFPSTVAVMFTVPAALPRSEYYRGADDFSFSH